MTVLVGSVPCVDEPVNDPLEVIARLRAELEDTRRRLDALLSWKCEETDFRCWTTTDDGGDW